MGRGRNKKPATTIALTNGLPQTYKPYVNYNLNPPVLNKTYEGEYVRTQLEEIKRKYECLRSYLHELKGQIVVVQKKLADKENNPRSRYNILLNKDVRTKGELEEWYARVFEYEALANQLPALQGNLRDVKRQIVLTFPFSLMKFVYEELEESFDLEKLEDYYKGAI